MMEILPLHEIRDVDKVLVISKQMKENGWQGPPVLVVEMNESTYQAITGTHRLAAAANASIEPEIYVIVPPPFAGDYESSDLFEQLVSGDDEERLAALEDLFEKGEVDKRALEIMKAEVE